MATEAPRGQHFVTVAIRHVPAGPAVYEGARWRATFDRVSDARSFAAKLAEKPWRVLA